MSPPRPRLTYSNVVSTLCLFLLLGGGAYAASQLPKNSVGTKQLKKNSVKGSKVANRSLTAVDIKGPVDSATDAAHAANADQAKSAAAAKDADQLDGLDSTAFQPASRVRVYAPDIVGGDPVDFTPDVTGVSVLVLDFNVPVVMGEIGQPSFTGGVDGQELTIVSLDEPPIFVNQSDLKLVGETISIHEDDTLSLICAGGVWYETGRSDNVP